MCSHRFEGVIQETDTLTGDINVLELREPSFAEIPLNPDDERSRLIMDRDSMLRLRGEISPFQWSYPNPEVSFSTLLLLRGNSGVGKTTAARCSAEWVRRPLLIIETENLAEKPFEQLVQFLQKAEKWKAFVCIENIGHHLTRPGTSMGSIPVLQALRAHRGLIFLTDTEESDLPKLIISQMNMVFHLRPHDSQTLDLLAYVLAREHNSFIQPRRLGDSLTLGSDPKTNHGTGWSLALLVQAAADLATSQEEPLDWIHLEKILDKRISAWMYASLAKRDNY